MGRGTPLFTSPVYDRWLACVNCATSFTTRPRASSIVSQDLPLLWLTNHRPATLCHRREPRHPIPHNGIARISGACRREKRAQSRSERLRVADRKLSRRPSAPARTNQSQSSEYHASILANTHSRDFSDWKPWTGLCSVWEQRKTKSSHRDPRMPNDSIARSLIMFMN